MPSTTPWELSCDDGGHSSGQRTRPRHQTVHRAARHAPSPASSCFPSPRVPWPAPPPGYWPVDSAPQIQARGGAVPWPTLTCVRPSAPAGQLGGTKAGFLERSRCRAQAAVSRQQACGSSCYHPNPGRGRFHPRHKSRPLASRLSAYTSDFLSPLAFVCVYLCVSSFVHWLSCVWTWRRGWMDRGPLHACSSVLPLNI
jgi:hypothetical protein